MYTEIGLFTYLFILVWFRSQPICPWNMYYYLQQHFFHLLNSHLRVQDALVGLASLLNLGLGTEVGQIELPKKYVFLENVK